LREAYDRAAPADFKAHVMRVAWGLMSDIRTELVEDALHSQDADLRAAAEALAARQSAGFVADYDDSADPGAGFRNPLLGR
jgi:hypothetical protein